MAEPVIGLTGPTGAGKSTVASVLEKLGCAVVDADIIARTVVNNRECLEQLRNTFGSEIIADGSLDRKILAKIAFDNKKNTEKLNAITHPAILKESKIQIENAKGSGVKAVVLDAPLLFESGADSLCDTTIAVILPAESRLKRIIARDNISKELAMERINAQHGDDYYISHAEYTFSGSTDWSILNQKVGELLRRILEKHA